MNIILVGIGNVGYNNLLYYTKLIREYNYTDYNILAVDVIERVSLCKYYRRVEDVPSTPEDYWLITLPTSYFLGCPDISILVDTVKSIVANHSKQSIIIIESTVPVGTSRMLSNELDMEIVCCPHRIWLEDTAHYGVNYTRVIGSTDNDKLEKAIKMYLDFKIPLFRASCVEIAELSKLVENTHRFIEIAYSEDIWRICNKLKLNYNELREAVNTKWNVKLLEARDGVDGECLPKDIRYLNWLMSTPIAESAIKSDKLYRISIFGRKNKCKKCGNNLIGNKCRLCG